MPTFTSYDGARLAYRETGDGAPLLCVPGGPQDSRYLSDLGGLAAQRRLILLDLRGTGGSPAPEDPAAYRCDRLVDDVEALRAHLGLERLDLLAHCAGANVAAQYAARHPERLARLALITPSTRAVGVDVTADDRWATARLRRDEPWFDEAYAALEAVVAGTATGEHVRAIAPFFYGRWDDIARAHRAAEDEQKNMDAVQGLGADGAFDPAATRAALAGLDTPVLVLAGEYDLNSPPRPVTELAALFPESDVVVQPRAGHFPWLDDADRFVRTTAAFLDRPAGRLSPSSS
ncbi:alpha/beta fold hydrolase [Streptomyces sp. NPDC048604]|uniref:alpha/beta fold hydrolase n=1 Tax=Streptomyces sp. NPDC048604 TaxID=3365578 RepID=UPI003719B268